MAVGAGRAGSSSDRILSVLGLFTTERPEWTIEMAAAELAVSATTAYRYFRRLADAGLVSPVSRGSYVLGPAIVEMDRQIQLCDPMLRAARPVMADLIRYAPDGAALLLWRLFHDRVMCICRIGGDPQPPAGCERGRLMPLFRGAPSRIILAHLPPRTLRSLFLENTAVIAEAGLGESWDTFRHRLTKSRREGVAVAHEELDPGRTGIAAPVFEGHAILGSLSFDLPDDRADEARVRRLRLLTVAGAREIERGMERAGAEAAPHPARAPLAH